MNWQPIETAPIEEFDGPSLPMSIVTDGKRVNCAYRIDDNGWFFPKGAPLKPTHWMQLPKPPEEDAVCHRERMTWQSLETAPKNTRVLGDGCFRDAPNLKSVQIMSFFLDTFSVNGLPFEPTQWMPLPEPTK